MDFGTALNQAKQMKQTFRAFEHIEEVLKFAAQKEGEVGDHESTIAKLKKKIADLKSEEAEVQASVEGKIQALQKSQAEAEEATEKALKIHDLKMDEIEEAEAEATKRLRSVEKRLQGIKATLE